MTSVWPSGDTTPESGRLHFDLQLKERPGKCLACNVTYGLPQVFTRHPVIDLKGVVREIETLLNGSAKCVELDVAWHADGFKRPSRHSFHVDTWGMNPGVHLGIWNMI